MATTMGAITAAAAITVPSRPFSSTKSAIRARVDHTRQATPISRMCSCSSRCRSNSSNKK